MKEITLKVLRVCSTKHQIAKINSVKKGIKMQLYIEQLIEADEQGLIDWEQLRQENIKNG